MESWRTKSTKQKIFTKILDNKLFLNLYFNANATVAYCLHCFVVACILKARLHGRFLSRQLDTIFVALKLQLQNRTCKPGVIFSAICRRDIAGISSMFETCCNLRATKIASSCRYKNRLCKRALRDVTSFGIAFSLTNYTSFGQKERFQYGKNIVKS